MPERGSGIQVLFQASGIYERIAFSLVEVYERVLVSRGLFSLFSQVFSGKIPNNIKVKRPLPAENMKG